MTQGRDEAEDEKRLVGAVLKGFPILMIDNVEQSLGGDFLCTIISDGKVNVRILGQTGKTEVDVRMLIYATGNNIKVRGDMTRRAIKCRMVANAEQPEAREFKVQDLDAYVLAHRRELVSAALTIMRAFVVAPDRQEVLAKLPRYNGFDRWSERVRGPLVWLGETDPCDTRASIRDDDPVTSTLAALLAAWVECPALGSHTIEPSSDLGWYLVDQVCALSNKVDHHDGDYVHPQLRAALETIMPRGITPDGLGRYLTRYVDRIIGGHRLRKRRHPTTKRAQYLLEPMPKAE